VRLKMRIRLIPLVGAGRFERPTPCAQGSLVASSCSIAIRKILIFTTNRGICFRSNSNPGGSNGSSSDTVLAQWNGVG
jgi:hypothetical protein